ncbi:MAG: diguanylate cyclase [Alphaproteobacteria bacterium]|jgi:diguanylate cyclase (GGDEF)-like protein|nr:diguanylate cyclase [Alphaproteobacteria bacterium]
MSNVRAVSWSKQQRPEAKANPGVVVEFPGSDSPMPGHYDTIFYLIRQTIGARHVTIQLDGEPRPPADDHMACIEAPLVSQGRRFGTLRAYAEEFESGASHLLAGFAVLVAEQHALWSEAHLDVLTKALTRRAFMSDLGRASATYQRSGRPCSLIMFDLDHFKAVNDTHGHAAGDAVLRAVAHVVQSELRRCDLLGRLGGEEFGVLIMADHVTALDIAERLRAVVEATVVRDYPEIAFTASLGVATTDETTDTRDAMIALADARLYAAKEGGRNQVLGAEGMMEIAALQAAE